LTAVESSDPEEFSQDAATDVFAETEASEMYSRTANDLDSLIKR
jgi:hypothetical protein